MAIQPTQPTDRGGLSKLLTIGGAVAGAASGGGVQGAITGASVGGTIGGLVSKPPTTPPIESQGMDRRRDTLGSDPLRAISEAQATLNTLPPDQFPETRRAFEQAMALAQRNQELGKQGRFS
tara:strand:+ start:907 stop:1272 length:366 start_codon:yes stop_codon:yes gene_type:complete